MSAESNGFDTFLVGLLNDTVQSVSDAIVEVIDAFAIDAGADDSIVFLIEARKELLQERQIGRRGVIEAG
jgi:hypothetical protein